ncbi:S41 family peptidase [Corallococcus sp. AS-1-6]|uniref:S41 family peptidase n=1 Tax=Corallococcus sp. AS-1-6 TaxID=2874599 RepID=UPI001CBADD1D|nr:S41 family peptidase [Corallococcus sp. AS-1-6]MBZ4373905.1 S41 family peptidase [Corallococcus sp. AS-1-6]
MLSPIRGQATPTPREVYSARPASPRPARGGVSGGGGRWRGAVLLVLAGLLAACATPHAASGTRAPEGSGVWRSRGYGWLLTVTPEGMRLHHETAAGCHPDPSSPAELKELFGIQEPGPSADVRDFLGAPGETRYRFDRLAALPAGCDTPRTWSALELFDVFRATFAEHYAAFPQRDPDWLARLDAQRSRVTPDMDRRALFTLFADALRSLNDAHVELLAGDADPDTLKYEPRPTGTLATLAMAAESMARPPRDVQREWMRAYRDGILQTVLRGEGHHVGNQRVLWGFAAPRVAYLNLLTMGGFVAGTEEQAPTLAQELAALEPVLDEALTAFAGADALILDVSNNRGGHDAVVRAIAERFTAEPRRAYSKWATGAKDVPPQEFTLQPSPRPSFHGPVYVVTSDITVSAGEVLTLALRALPNVVHVGTATRGAFSDMLVKPLPNGWTVHLSNEHYADARGQDYEARGLPPQRPLEVFKSEDPWHSHARALRALADSLVPPEASATP